MNVVCKRCGEPFTVERKGGQVQRFCTRNCKNKAAYERRSGLVRTCAWCGKQFAGTGSGGYVKTYCSVDCRRSKRNSLEATGVGHVLTHDPLPERTVEPLPETWRVVCSMCGGAKEFQATRLQILSLTSVPRCAHCGGTRQIEATFAGRYASAA